jgi:DNA polymerase III epsilon subunit-like protein
MLLPSNKPTGYFEHILAIDCETTGLNFNGDDASDGHQAVSWGVIVANSTTFKPVEELYVEIRWNEQSKANRQTDPKFGTRAEKVHGLSFDYLEKNGKTEAEAVELLGNLIIKYWGVENCIHTLGHNVHLFDMPFLRAMFRRHAIPLKFGNRHLDSSSLSFGTLGAFNSDDMFKTMGFDQRKEHNALDDIRMTLETYRTIKLLWKSKVGLIHECRPEENK